MSISLGRTCGRPVGELVSHWANQNMGKGVDCRVGEKERERDGCVVVGRVGS